MSLHLLFAVCALLAPQEQELTSPVRSDAFDFEFALPKGWEPTKTSGSLFFRLQAPKGKGLADGACQLAHHNSNHPVSLAYLAEAFRKRAEADNPGYKPLTEKNLTAGGFPAHQIVFTATKSDKELVFVHTVIQRQLIEYFIFDVVAAASVKERAIDLADKMVATFRCGFPQPRDREDRIDRTSATLKAAAPKTALAGTFWHLLIVGEKKFGWQKTVVREAKVDGISGWEFEIECRQEDAEGGTRSDISKGAFTSDGTIQRVEVTRAVRTPKDPPVDVKETASLTKGVARVSREFLGQKVERELKVPESTILGDVAETVRRLVATAPAGKYCLRVLEPFCDFPIVEEWENAGSTLVHIQGKHEQLYQALVTNPRQAPLEWLYDLDGVLRRRRGAGALMTLKRCTEEEARKP